MTETLTASHPQHDDAAYHAPGTADGAAGALNGAGLEPPANTMEMLAAGATPQQHQQRPTGDAAVAEPPQIPLAPIKVLQARFNPLADAMLYVVVFLGGGIGAGMRYAIDLVEAGALPVDSSLHAFHPATFVANMVASFAFAVLTSYVSQASWIRKRTRELTSRGVGMGLFGGLSTLSTLSVEGLAAVRDGSAWSWCAYIAATFICGFVLAWYGARLGLAMSVTRANHIAGEAAAVLRSHAAERAGQARHYHVAQAAALADASSSADQDHADEDGSRRPPSFEPDPITAQIPLVADPMRGEAR